MPLFHQTIQRLKQILRQSKIVNHLLAPDAPREMTTTVIYPRSSLMCTHLSSRTPKQLSTVSDNATRCQLCVRNCELIFFALLFQKKTLTFNGAANCHITRGHELRLPWANADWSRERSRPSAPRRCTNTSVARAHTQTEEWLGGVKGTHNATSSGTRLTNRAPSTSPNAILTFHEASRGGTNERRRHTNQRKTTNPRRRPNTSSTTRLAPTPDHMVSSRGIGVTADSALGCKRI